MKSGASSTTDRAPPGNGDKLWLAIAFGIAVGYLASLALTYQNHVWILDASGRPVVDDFVAFWSAGHLALKGMAFATYDPLLEHAQEVRTIGHDFPGTLGFTYPPAFLFVIAVLARLPFVAAFVSWCAATLGLYAVSVGAIARRQGGWLLACAAPWVLTALTPGQNGFLTAALMGASLFLLEKRPALAGLLLGLLAYKPQFGILFPLALAAAGYWRAFFVAGAAALAVNALAGAVFGFDTIPAFLHSLGTATESHLRVAGLGWSKLQSVYGLVRALGFSGPAGWTAQATVTLLLALAVMAVWRARLPFALKAAFLATASVLATPYVFVYDLPVLSVAVAFIARERRLDVFERVALAFTAPCVFAFLWLPIPSALFASFSIFAIVARRLGYALAPGRTARVPADAAYAGPSP